MKKFIFILILMTIAFSSKAYSEDKVHSDGFTITYENLSNHIVQIKEGFMVHEVMELAPHEFTDHSVYLLGHVNLHFAFKSNFNGVYQKIDDCPKALFFTTTYKIQIRENAAGELYCEIYSNARKQFDGV